MFTRIFIGEVHGPIQFASGTGDQSWVREGCARPSLTLNAYCTRYTALHCTQRILYQVHCTALHCTYTVPGTLQCTPHSTSIILNVMKSIQVLQLWNILMCKDQSWVRPVLDLRWDSAHAHILCTYFTSILRWHSTSTPYITHRT